LAPTWTRQAEAASPIRRDGRGPPTGEVHVIVDELGDPVHPETYSDMFEVRAKLPKIRLAGQRQASGGAPVPRQLASPS
jgi:hypothetical protein